MNNNNQGGNNNSAAFSAYNAQKNSAKSAANNAVLNKGMDVASKAIPALKAAKPVVNLAAENAAMRNRAAEEANAGEGVDGAQNETQNETQSPLASMANTSIETAKDTAKTAAKQAVKKFALAHLPVIIGIVVGFIIIIGVMLLITVGIEYADQLADNVIYSSESALNFATGNGFKTNIEVIQENINEAAKEYSGIDRGLLYAVVNNSAYISTSVYEQDSPSSSEESAFDAAKKFLVDKYSVHAFHTMKLDMLGSTGDAGSIIYSLMGEKIEVECVDPDKYSVKNNVVALSKYVYNGLITAKDVAITQTGENLTFLYGGGQLKMIDNVVSYANQGANYFETHYNELVNLIDNLPPEAIRNDWNYVKQQSNECALKYATDANGAYKIDPKTGTYATLKAQYKTVKENDYKQFYNYIKKVYTPTMYNSIWDSLNDEAKINLANEVWNDLVESRNSFYTNNGINNTLSYTFDDYGNVVAQADISYAGFYMGSVATSEVAQAALTWKQGGNSPWANDYIGTSTIGQVGCFVTSVAKLIAVSGTQILTSTFDPGLFVSVVKENGGFDGNNFRGYGWSSIAPNFKRVDWVGLDNRSFDANAGTLSDYIKSSMAASGYAGVGYYYVFLVNYTRGDGSSGTHFISIVGENERGELMASDPGNGKTYSIEEFSANTGGYYRNAKLGGISVYYASDVATGGA